MSDSIINHNMSLGMHFNKLLWSINEVTVSLCLIVLISLILAAILWYNIQRKGWLAGMWNSKNWYIEQHEFLWQSIYDYYKSRESFYSITFIDISVVKRLLIKDKGIHNDCYLCEYANRYADSVRSLEVCCFCPALKKGISCLDGLYYEFTGAISSCNTEKVLELCLKIKDVCRVV